MESTLDEPFRYSKRQWDGIVRSWRRQLHLWDRGTPANTATGDGDGAACAAEGGDTCDGMDARDEGEFDPIMMDEEHEEAGVWAGDAAHDEGIDDD